jgi:hypothetical protein
VLAALGAAVLGRRRRRTTAVLGAAVTGAGAAVLLAGPAPAAAQGLTTSYPVERMRLTGDRDGVLDAEWGDVGGHLDLDLGLWVGYSDDPLNLYTQMDGADRERVGSLVARRLGADVVAAFDLWKRVQLGLSVPLILSQSDDLGALMATPPELSGFGLGGRAPDPQAGPAQAGSVTAVGGRAGRRVAADRLDRGLRRRDPDRAGARAGAVARVRVRVQAGRQRRLHLA